jgi:Restriction endonuclease BamHI
MFAVEWETGNVSSSHRALNKMALGIRDDILCGGILVLPSRRLYYFLTDRIGNYREVEPYFDIWRHCGVTNRGILAVIEIEHDREDATTPILMKGDDGYALFAKSKRVAAARKENAKRKKKL